MSIFGVKFWSHFCTESSNCVAIPDAMDSADDMSK